MVFHRSVELSGGAVHVVVSVKGVANGGLDAGRCSVDLGFRNRFFADDAGDVFNERIDLFLRECAVIAATEFFGLRAFEEPGGGSPVFLHGAVHGAERRQITLHLRQGEFVAELAVGFMFVTDVAKRVSEAASGLFDGAAAGDEDAELAEVGFIEGMWLVGGGRRGGCGDHGLAPDRPNTLNVLMYIYRVVRLAQVVAKYNEKAVVAEQVRLQVAARVDVALWKFLGMGRKNRGERRRPAVAGSAREG